MKRFGVNLKNIFSKLIQPFIYSTNISAQLIPIEKFCTGVYTIVCRSIAIFFTLIEAIK
jgi:hypothetical protein